MKNPNIHNISAKDMHEIYQSKDVVLIDVRELTEWMDAHIPKATHIPLAELTSKISAVAPDVEQPIYLHCKAGMRSYQAAQQLAAMGYKKVYSVDGGIDDWIANGFDVA